MQATQLRYTCLETNIEKHEEKKIQNGLKKKKYKMVLN